MNLQKRKLSIIMCSELSLELSAKQNVSFQLTLAGTSSCWTTLQFTFRRTKNAGNRPEELAHMVNPVAFAPSASASNEPTTS